MARTRIMVTDYDLREAAPQVLEHICREIAYDMWIAGFHHGPRIGGFAWPQNIEYYKNQASFTVMVTDTLEIYVDAVLGNQFRKRSVRAFREVEEVIQYLRGIARSCAHIPYADDPNGLKLPEEE